MFYVRLILISIFGAALGGAAMALLNFFIELLKSNSVFKFADLWSISLAHMLIWSILGAIAGICWAIYAYFWKKNSLALANIVLYYTFIAGWLIVLSYINMNILPKAFAKISLLWNAILLIVGIILFSALIKYLAKLKIQKIPLWLKLYLGLLVIVHLGSFMVSQGILSEKNVTPATKKINIDSNLNVIIILLDAVRYDHLSCSGYPRQTSPNIDRIAAGGTVFANAFSQSSHTQEAVSSLFTAAYSCTHNVNTLAKALPNDILTMPSIFKSNGYKTTVFSTNPNVNDVRGFNKDVDDFFGIQLNINYYTILYNLLFRTANLPILLLGDVAKQALTLSDSLFPNENKLSSKDPAYVTQKVISWIDGHKKSPFFIYIHYHGGHGAYQPPTPYNKIFDPNFTGKLIDGYPANLGMFLPFVKGNPMKPRELENMIAQYDGQILYHDDQLGKLFKYLKEIKIYDKTLLVITSDHGEEFYEHQGWGHGYSLFDEVIHIPLIFHCPGLIPAGRKITELAGSIDIFSTIISLCGWHENFKFPYHTDSFDQSEAILTGSHHKKREFIFSEVSHGDGHWAKCLRSQNYKAIISKFGGRTFKSLFNLVTDPREQNDILAKEIQTGDTYFRMIEDIVNSYKFKAPEKGLDEETKARLRSLGYIR